MNDQEKSGKPPKNQNLLKHVFRQVLVLLLLQGQWALLAPAGAMWKFGGPSLEDIQKKSPWVTRQIMKSDFWHAIESLAQNPDLEVWNLQSKLESESIGDAGVIALADALSRPESKVHTLRLVQNDIGSDGATALARALSLPHSKVHTLDLAGNRIGDSGIAALAGALRLPHSKVHTLNLENNGIESSGVIALAGALRLPHSKVQSLNLRGNQIGDTGAAALVCALIQPHSKVTELDLENNSVKSIVRGIMEKAIELNKKKAGV